MASVSFVDALLIINSTGVLGLGIGAFKWAWAIEKRMTIIEVMAEKSGRQAA